MPVRKVRIGERFNPHRLFDGSFIPEAVSRHRDLSPGAKLIWGRFYRYAGSRGDIFPSIESLAAEIGLSAKQTRRYLHELIEQEFIEFEEKKGKVRTYYFKRHKVFCEDDDEQAVEGINLSDSQPSDDDNLCTPVSGSTAEPWTPGSGSTPLPDKGGAPLPDTGAERESYEKCHERESYSPIIPKQEEANPFEEEPTQDIIGWITGVWNEFGGGKILPTMPSRKNRALLEVAVSENDALNRDRLLGFWESGGRSIDDFVRQNISGIQKSPRKISVGRREEETGRGWRKGWIRATQSAAPDRNEPSSPVALPDPPEKAQWDERIPELAIRVWDSKLDALLRNCKRNSKFDVCWPEVLNKCRALVDAGKGINLNRVLKGEWVDIVNGARDFLMENKPSAPVSTGNKTYDAMERLKQKLLAGKKV